MAATALPPATIVRAETYYLPPPPRRGQPALDWSQVPGAELVYRWAETHLRRRLPVPTESVPDHPGLYARIDDGRWLAECDNCGSAWIVSVVDLRFGCVDTVCKRDWVQLILPDDTDAAEAEALALQRRFWWHPLDPRNPSVEPEPPVEPDPEEQP